MDALARIKPIIAKNVFLLRLLFALVGLVASTLVAHASTVATPAFSPVGGTYSSAQNVTITSATGGASIRDTTDGSTPTSTTGKVYSGPVNISTTTTLKAIASASGMTDSTVFSATYTIGSSPVISSAGIASGIIGAPFSYQITASNSPASYGATGLPAGLSLNPSTGLISGTPGVPGNYPVTLGATNASGTGNQALALQVFIDWNMVGAADFNGDGKPDLILQNTVNGQRAIWLMNGTTETSSVSLGFVTTDWDLVGAADFNGDGKPDLIWQNTVSGQRAIWLMNGTTYVSSVSLGTVTTDWDFVGAADFNKNGNSDLILQNTVNGQRAIWLMNGTTYVSSVSLGTVTTDWNLVGAADFNGDGYPDLLWQNTVNGQRTIWLMNGTTYVSSVSLGTVSTDWNLAGAADLNGDGKPDLLWQDMPSRQCAIWLMNGTTETSVVTFTISPPPTAAPAFSPAAGTYTAAQTVTITTATGGASIAYTTDGSMPTESGGTVTHGLLYTTPLTINAKTTLTAIAFKTGYYTDSATTSGTYTINIPASIGGLRLWLEADVGVTVNSNGFTWADQSGNSYNATQGTGANQPAWVASQLNGRPVVHFSGSQSLTLLNVLSGAAQGEIFAVVRSSAAPNTTNCLWAWGGASGSVYPYSNGTVYDDFGTNTWVSLGKPPVDLTQYQLYNISSSSSEWTQRFNGLASYDRLGNTVSFRTNPSLGTGNGNFTGDIAEIIVYNAVLTPAQRDTIGTYLGNKYNLYTVPPAPTSLAAAPLSPGQVSLQWSAPARSDHVSYLVERSTGSGSFTQVASVADGLSYIDTGLAAATTYTYRVRAQGYAGTSDYNHSDNNMPISATTLLTGGGTDLPLTGMRLWLKADAGLSAGNGINLWADQSGNGNNATQQTNASQQPTLALATTGPNGRPVVHFAGSQSLTLPNVMSGATQGEIFAVVRSSAAAGTRNGLWAWGGAGGGLYPYSDGAIYDDFGTNTWVSLGQPPVDLTQYQLYNISSSSSEWTQRFNGLASYDRLGNTVSFRTNPVLGQDPGGGYFTGDIAEIIVYNQALTQAQRIAVDKYIIAKYNLPVPSSLVAPVVTVTPVTQYNLAGDTTLSWLPVANAAYYSVERQVDNGTFISVAQVSATSFNDANILVPPGKVICYRVQAVNYAGGSPYSKIVTTLSPYAIDLTDGLTYEVDVLFGLNPLADNSKFFLPYPTPPPPTFSPAAGNYTSSISVSISDTDSAAAIYYTTDGTTPTTASAKYGAAIPVTAATTINAIAVDNGLASAVASASYTFGTLPPAPIFTLQAPSGATLTTP